jgi:hypothetical protein
MLERLNVERQRLSNIELYLCSIVLGIRFCPERDPRVCNLESHATRTRSRSKSNSAIPLRVLMLRPCLHAAARERPSHAVRAQHLAEYPRVRGHIREPAGPERAESVHASEL